MIDHISKLDSQQREDTIHKINILYDIYKQIGLSIKNQNILPSIQSQDPDIYHIDTFIDKNNLWEELSSISSILYESFDIKRPTIIRSNDSQAIKSKLSDSYGSNITTIEDNTIGAYIKSHDKIFSRNIEKDIDKLTRSI